MSICNEGFGVVVLFFCDKRFIAYSEVREKCQWPIFSPNEFRSLLLALVECLIWRWWTCVSDITILESCFWLRLAACYLLFYITLTFIRSWNDIKIDIKMTAHCTNSKTTYIKYRWKREKKNHTTQLHAVQVMACLYGFITFHRIANEMPQLLWLQPIFFAEFLFVENVEDSRGGRISMISSGASCLRATLARYCRPPSNDWRQHFY